jgi:exopolysaccharide biosynthesis polyprenyl glycosylphosphotransferase
MESMNTDQVDVGEAALHTGKVKFDKKYVALDTSPVIQKKESSIYFGIKRLADVVLSLIAIIILSPFFLLTALVIKLESKGNVIYTQRRTGKSGKEFKMLKFRSMYQDAELLKYELLDKNEMDGPVFKIADDPRITKVGKFIRKTSIDELPQLFNIIRGEMSIVGPRPLAVYETQDFNQHENLRHLVKPGLTCFWQISGRNDISFEQWIALDLEYLQKMSVWTDIKIIFRTIIVVITGKGAY